MLNESGSREALSEVLLTYPRSDTNGDSAVDVVSRAISLQCPAQ